MKPRDWPKVEELYHAALERPVAEREAFLDQACGGDEELRREVQSLLSHEREAERLMERPAAAAATQKLAVVRGTRLGPYEVTDLLGAGGMGEVYRDRDTRLGREREASLDQRRGSGRTLWRRGLPSPAIQRTADTVLWNA